MRSLLLLLALLLGVASAVGAVTLHTRGDTREDMGNAQWAVHADTGEDVAWARYMATGSTRWLDVAVKRSLDTNDSFYAVGFLEGLLAAEDILASYGGRAPRVTPQVRAFLAAETSAPHVAYARGIVDGIKKARGGSSNRLISVESLLARADALSSPPLPTSTPVPHCASVQWAEAVLRAHNDEVHSAQDQSDIDVTSAGLPPVVGSGMRVLRTLALPGGVATQLSMVTAPGVLVPLTRVALSNQGMTAVSADASGLQWLGALRALLAAADGAGFAAALPVPARDAAAWMTVDAKLVDRYAVYADAVWAVGGAHTGPVTHACVANNTMADPVAAMKELRYFDDLAAPPTFDEGQPDGGDEGQPDGGGLGALLGGLFSDGDGDDDEFHGDEFDDEFDGVAPAPLTPAQALREAVYEHIGLVSGLSHTCALFAGKACVPAAFVHPLKVKCPLLAYDAADSRHHLVTSVPGKFFADSAGLSSVAVEILVRNGWSYTRMLNRAEMVWVHDHGAVPMSTFQPGIMMLNHVGGELQFTEKGLLVESLRELDEAEALGPQSDLRADLIHPRTVLLYDFQRCSGFWDAYKDDEAWVNTTWLYKATNQGGGLGTRVVTYEGLEELAETYLRDNSYRCRKADEYPLGEHPAPFHVLQRYIADPMLWGGRKFEVRTYLLIAQADPLLVLFHPGWVRVNALPFTMADDQLDNVAVHLSSPTRQRSYWLYDQVAPLLSWPTRALEGVLRESGAPEGALEATVLPRMRAIAGRVVETVRDELVDQTVGLFGMYALDFMLDAQQRVWLLEASSNPPMRVHHNPALQRELEGVVEEALNIALEMRERFAFGAPTEVIESVETWDVLINEEGKGKE